jgi:hypothetical protein
MACRREQAAARSDVQSRCDMAVPGRGSESKLKTPPSVGTQPRESTRVDAAP